MRQTIVLVALSLCAVGASAQSYRYRHYTPGPSAQEINSKVETCASVGRLSAANYLHRERGEPISIAPPQFANHFLRPMIEWAMAYGGNVASSEREAYMTAGSKCLDNYERMAYAGQRGQILNQSDLK
jgi:hypothetical protein